MSILITGATGQLGTKIIERLAEIIPPEQLIAGVRDPQKAEYLQSLGVQIRIVDYDQPETLEEAFTGVSRLLLISSSNTDDGIRYVQHSHVIEAAKKAKVEHLLYTSFAFPKPGADPQHNVHLRTEQAILDAGLKYTFLRNALYTDFVGVIGLNKALVSGELVTASGDWVFNTVTRRDLALGTASILASSDHKNAIYELTASETWDFRQLAVVLSEIAGQPVVHKQDAGVQHWIYPFLSRLDTASTSQDLERFVGGPLLSLKESIIPFVRSTAD
ncbi:SDR family oxidoreductase [Paenibacillus agri]|uniref:SDR family oxidoreductase n=1 Tax=Paenibacillus agri TaxID=2744309 RepID=A0A850ERB3_9BACL|nr:SDR family oxidoreductase [Paenibacillus agri]NUU62279.1 SDR family oxidoreductase [Paenibacillus agri]